MTTNDLLDLRDVVESIRVEAYPHLDRAFLLAVIRAEEANPDDDNSALQEISKAIDTALGA
jgi:hypothetical protein